jgi:hypothetical protein
MTSQKNKGFSLVDVLVAVAVMALLISPIVIQTFTAIETNQKSKEKQVVIDNADLVMEYFKSTSKEKLVVGDVSDDVYIKTVATPVNVTCNLYNPDGSVYVCPKTNPTDPDVSSFVYSATDYTLGETRLGRESGLDKNAETAEQQAITGSGNVYSRTVILDDLNNNALENKCTVKYYDNYNDGKAALDTARAADPETDPAKMWQLTSEYSIVKYDANNHVCAAIVQDHNYNYTNPNSFGLGNIQDLDSSKMAIIQGNATSLDRQFYDDFVGSLASIVAANKESLIAADTWKNYNTTEKIKVAFENTRENQATFSRLITISVKAKEVVSDEAKSYTVKVTAKYTVSHSFLNQYNGNANYVYTNSYTIFEQDFNTNESPDVFFVYEPFIINDNATYTSYAYNDYITVDADKYTSTANPSKIYLIKPDKTWAQVNNKDRNVTDDGATEISQLKVDNENFNYYFTKKFTRTPDGEGGEVVTSSFSPVKIYLSYIKNNDNSNKPLQVVSNISTKKNAAGETTINTAVTGGSQFNYGGTTNTDFPGITVDTATQTLSAYPDMIADYNSTGKDEKSLVPPLDEASTSDGRLYSITVTFHNDTKPSESEVYTYFTGAKGAD